MRPTLRPLEMMTPVLIALLMLPLATYTINGGNSQFETTSEAADEVIELPDDAEQWPAGARTGATSWLREIADSDGDTGKWTSSEFGEDGTIWVAYYSAAGRDIRVAEWNGWTWYVHEVYTFGDVGKYAQIALDSNDNPRVVYYDVTNAMLRISRYDGSTWSTHPVAPGEDTGSGDPYRGAGRIGFAIDNSDSEWYSFYIEVDASWGNYNLSFAFWDSSDDTWAYGSIDDGLGEDSDLSRWSDIGRFSSLQIGSNNHPRVAYNCEIWEQLVVAQQVVDRWGKYSLRFAEFDGSGWSITDIHVNETGSNYRPAWWLEYEIDDLGNQYVAYQNTSWYDSVRLATNSGNGWSHELVHNETYDNLGAWLRIDVDSLGELHLAYRDETNDDLLLTRGESGNWEKVKIAELGDVGSHADIVIDDSDEEIFSYYDADNADLIIATPALDSDADGLADEQDTRCPNTPVGATIDNTGCHWLGQTFTQDGSDNQYVDVVEGDDGLYRLVHYRGLAEGEFTCDRDTNNMTDDCNLVYQKQNADGTWGSPEIVDQGGETGRYASIEIAPDGSEHIAFHAKTQTNGWLVTQTAARIASNDGTGWTVTDIAESNSTGWYTDLAIDSAGNKIVAYTDQSGAYGQLKVARDNSGSWVEENVSVNATFASIAYINDTAHIAYLSTNPQMIRLAIENGSGGWDIHNVTTDGQVNTYRLDIDISHDGNLQIAYFRGTDSSGDTVCDASHECTIQVATWNGSGFVYDILHQMPGSTASYLSVDSDKTGRIHAAWYDGNTQSLMVASPTKDGWEALTLLEDGNHGTYPKLVVDENGWEHVWYHNIEDDGRLRQVDRFAWDADHDFVEDDDDQCPNTEYGAEDIDIYGCSFDQRDDDYDSIPNNEDLCPNTPGFERHLANSDGCSPSQLDSDDDGVNDADDECPNTTDLTTLDANGCSEDQRDSDGDGISDSEDQCPNTPAGDSIDLNGCGESERDNDGDGVNDKDDIMPQDASQHTDSDGDGLGDNPEGTNGDDCPNEAGTSTVDQNGCPDLDGDGTSDANDEDDDGDGWSDVDEIANGTDPRFMLDFPRPEGGSGGDGGTDGGSDGGTDGGTDNTDGGAAGGAEGGMNLMLVGGIVAVILVLLLAVVGLLLSGGKKQDSMPAIPSLAEAEAALAASAKPAAGDVTASSGQTGEMIKTDKACKHCGKQEVHHIPSYGADYCKACSQYN